MSAPQTTIRSSANYLRLNFGEIWFYRDMLFFLVLRDFKIRYKQSFMGILWALLQPITQTLLFTFVFSHALKMEVGVPYPLFLLCGLLPWNYFLKVFSGGTTSVVNEAELIKKVYFPRIILPLSQALSAFIDFALVFIVLLALFAFYGYLPTSRIFLLPFVLFFTMIFGVGMSLLLAPLNVRFRDIQIALPLFQQSLFFLSPITYALSKTSHFSQMLLSLNPITLIVESFRYCVLDNTPPIHLLFPWTFVAVILVFLGGLFFFNFSQRKFADVI